MKRFVVKNMKTGEVLSDFSDFTEARLYANMRFNEDLTYTSIHDGWLTEGNPADDGRVWSVA